ncbi:hypothetical protein HY604_02660 [Candidatus Peregrinibacteria bacterium]|nr:hypothetical protein [Candidatus Peregrinibacteria bacterium]
MHVKTEIFSKLLRDLEAEIGTGDLGKLILQSMILSIENLKVNDAKAFMEQLVGIMEIFANTEPKFGIINYNLKKFYQAFSNEFGKDKSSHKKWKKLAIKELEEILNLAKKQKQLLLENAEKIDVDGKTILIHDHSHSVQDVLVHYKKMGKHFRVVIAEQELEKTHSNIERLHNAEIPFQVVPAYMLSHVHRKVDMLFFGAVTLKDTMDFVMDPGTNGLISEFHVAKVPIYMFIVANKFSLWKSKKRAEVFIHKHLRKHEDKAIEYERIKYSHDRVPSNLFHKIITDRGIFTPVQLKKFFAAQMKKYG